MRAVVALAVVLVCGACTSGGKEPLDAPPSGGGPTNGEVTCAPDIRRTVIGEVHCGLVTVPDRTGGSGTVTVHVTRVTPPGGASDDAPVLVVPGVASTPNYLGLSPMAQRTGREIVIVDARGTAHSSPVLSCPEVAEATTDELVVGTRPGAAADHDYLGSVAACAARLREEGVDPSAFTSDAIAADLADVRAALGIERWSLIAFGSAGRFVPELMRLDGGAVDSVILDSPELPDLDPVEAAARLTPRVVRGLLATCAQDRACRARFPRAERLWSDARRRVARHPVHLAAGSLGIVRLDGPMLVRIVRAIVSDGGSSGLSFTPPAVPAVLSEVATGGGPILEGEIAPLLEEQDPFCLGYIADCLHRLKPSEGAYFSMHCGELGLVGVLPAGADPLVSDVLSRRLNAEVCRRWGVEPADADAAPLTWTVPTLVLAGRYAPYAPLADLRRLVAGLPAGSLVIDPGGADNVLPRTECLLTLRRTWLDDPVADVERPACLAGERIEWYLPGA